MSRKARAARRASLNQARITGQIILTISERRRQWNGQRPRRNPSSLSLSGTGSTWPDIVFQRVIFVETTIPLSPKQDGYDRAQLESLIEAVGKYMEKENAEKAEIISADWIWGVELKNPAVQ